MKNKGHLQKSIDYSVQGDGLSIGTDKVQARILHYGGTIRPRNAKMLAWKNFDGQWVFAKEVKIPARPFMIWKKEWNKGLENTINRWFGRGAK